MKMKKSIYTALVVLLTLPSCVQEDPVNNNLSEEGTRIYFRSYLPTVTQSRAGVITKENLAECRVTSFNPDDKKLIDPETGKMTPYFRDIRFIKDDEGRFITDDETAGLWPDSRSTLHFLAYYPSVETMRETVDDKKFILTNYSTSEGGGAVLDYRLEKFIVAPDIADQVDFVTAYSVGSQQENGEAGIELNFSHQLARIDISAWGASEKYDFEIAGVRIGNPLTQGDFCFSYLSSPTGLRAAWLNTEGYKKPVEHIFTTGEATVFLSKWTDSHASADNAVSLMGNAGPAMVIPMLEKIGAWEGKGDPLTDILPYSTDKLYFSVLLRVTDREGETVYPYPNDRDNIPVVYLAIGNDRSVIRRVYKIDGEYYTSGEKSNEFKYLLGKTEKIRGFCWAALPVGAKWEAGKIYEYKLNYSTGIGWQDPADPNPGEPIIERGMVPFEVNVEDWVAADDHDPNLDVPKR